MTSLLLVISDLIQRFCDHSISCVASVGTAVTVAWYVVVFLGVVVLITFTSVD